MKIQLLISTLTKSILLTIDTNAKQITGLQVGSKPRKGNYGACFAAAATAPSVCATPDFLNILFYFIRDYCNMHFNNGNNNNNSNNGNNDHYYNRQIGWGDVALADDPLCRSTRSSYLVIISLSIIF
jgi:hypothetical protein